MGSHGIKDQVAIIGVGCTPFAEHWDSSLDDLIIDGAHATYASAGVAQDDIDAFWFGTSQFGCLGPGHGRPSQDSRQADHPRGELLRHRF